MILTEKKKRTMIQCSGCSTVLIIQKKMYDKDTEIELALLPLQLPDNNRNTSSQDAVQIALRIKEKNISTAHRTKTILV